MDGRENYVILVNLVKHKLIKQLHTFLYTILRFCFVLCVFGFILCFSFIKECKNGTYISNGKCVKCQGECKDGEPCNKLTGKIDNGCDNHWTGKFCEGTLIDD